MARLHSHLQLGETELLQRPRPLCVVFFYSWMVMCDYVAAGLAKPHRLLVGMSVCVSVCVYECRESARVLSCLRPGLRLTSNVFRLPNQRQSVPVAVTQFAWRHVCCVFQFCLFYNLSLIFTVWALISVTAFNSPTLLLTSGVFLLLLLKLPVDVP